MKIALLDMQSQVRTDIQYIKSLKTKNVIYWTKFMDIGNKGSARPIGITIQLALNCT